MRAALFLAALFLAALFLACGCAGGPAPDRPALDAEPSPGWVLSSPDFEDGGALPDAVACGPDQVARSPALAWTAPPEGAAALALVARDLDGARGPRVLWVVTGLPASAGSVAGGQDPPGQPGVNDSNWVGWAGPCPSAGSGRHRIRFELVALDTVVDLPQAASLAQLQPAARGHLLGLARLSATAAAEP